MGEHTPTPWKVFSKNGVLAILSPKEQDVVHWTGFDAAQFDDATNKANAAFIVKAVNSHADLMKALERCERLINEALPKFNWAKSALDANAIKLLNEVPLDVRKALAKVSA